MLTIEDLINAGLDPEPYEPGEELWNDPHISKMMLDAHLNPNSDAASYKPEKISAICDFILQATDLQRGNSVVDLGCGPGLYCSKLADRGYRMTGIDRSENSIRYAKAHDRDSHYILGSYLVPFGNEQFDAALMVSQDYGVLCPGDRRLLLANIRDALQPKGCFAFDIPSLAALQNRINTAAEKWYVSDAGFWRPHKHFVLEKTVIYTGLSALCDFYAVLDNAGAKFYRIYQTYFSPDTIRTELEQNGFLVEAVLSNLLGDDYSPESPVIGILCRKA